MAKLNGAGMIVCRTEKMKIYPVKTGSNGNKGLIVPMEMMVFPLDGINQQVYIQIKERGSIGVERLTEKRSEKTMRKDSSIKFLEELIAEYTSDLENGNLTSDMKFYFQGRKTAFELSLEIVKGIYCE